MQSFIKDNKLIVNTMIHDNERKELLDFLKVAEIRGVSATPLYNVEGNKSGIAFKLKGVDFPKGYYTKKEKLSEYLYELHYDELDEEFAKKYIEETYMHIGGCTSVRKGNLYGRNYDWFYDYSNEFVVHIPKSKQRNASISITSFPNKLSATEIDNDEFSNYYRVIPFLVLDGINEHGVIANINVTSDDLGITEHSTPRVQEKMNLSFMMIIRFILDNFKTAKEAAEYIRDYVALTSILYDGYLEEIHLMIADKDDTYLLEVIDGLNTLYKMEDDFNGRTYMTNFHLSGTTVDDSGHINFESVEPHGMGLERYDIISDKFNNIENEDDMIELMTQDLKYTNAYDISINPFWKTEFSYNYGEPYGDLTVTTPLEQYEPIIEIVVQRFEERTRKIKNTWQTVHSSIYNIEDRKLILFVQEKDIKYEFNLKEEQK